MTKQKNRMKKAAAVFLSIAFYIGVFLLLAFLSLQWQLSWLFFGMPVVIAAYFVLAGNLFFHRLGLSRWLLWAAMNGIGGLCSWILFMACVPALLFNGFILILLVPSAVGFAIVWGVVGIGFLCVGLFQRRSNADGTR